MGYVLCRARLAKIQPFDGKVEEETIATTFDANDSPIDQAFFTLTHFAEIKITFIHDPRSLYVSKVEEENGKDEEVPHDNISDLFP